MASSQTPAASCSVVSEGSTDSGERKVVAALRPNDDAADSIISQNAHILIDSEVNKSVRWMPWHLLAMKDVGSDDTLRGAANQAMIRRSPNGETQ